MAPIDVTQAVPAPPAVLPSTIDPAPAPPPAGPASIGRRLWGFKWLLLGAAILIGGTVWFAIPRILGPAVATDQVTRADLVETVVATGSVETPFRVTISSQITGTVLEVEVAEGQRVSLGQKLVSLESRELQSDVVQAQGAVDQAEAHMRQLAELTLPTAGASLAEAQATLLNAEQTLLRAIALVRTGDETRVALDAARKGVDIAHTQVRTAELQVYTASPGGSDHVTGQTQLSQAVANRATAIARLGYATIAAPRAGVLIARSVERGTVVQPGTPLLTLAPDGPTQLRLAIDERNLGKLALQQPAIASADAFSDQRFAAVLSYINPAVDIARAAVEVKLTVTDPPAYLRQDMTVSVDIEVARAAKALSLPSRSVRELLSGTPWVLALQDGRAVKLPVKLGIQGATRIEITAGLTEGAQVIPMTSDIAAGDRVRSLTP